MNRRRPTFAKSNTGESWYDLIGDYELIEASFAKQYGIRLSREEDMSWVEFTTLLAGLDETTPLGKIVAIRSENDKDILKRLTKDQHRIRNEWRAKHSPAVPSTKKAKADYNQAIEGFRQMFLAMAEKRSTK